MNHNFFSSFLIDEQVVFNIFPLQCHIIIPASGSLCKDTFTVEIKSVGWFVIVPHINIFNRNLVEQKHPPTRPFLYVSLPGSGLGPNSTAGCWYIPEVW